MVYALATNIAYVFNEYDGAVVPIIYLFKIIIMRKIIFLLTVLALITSGCVTGPKGYLKRSANNKLFDRQGFQGGKRTPLYNKKYISRAKKNVASGKYDDDEFWDDVEYEEEDIALANREIYREMLKKDLEERNGKKRGWSLFGRKEQKPEYPLTAQAGYIMDHHNANEDLKQELAEIKAVLHQTKRDFASLKCPTAEYIEGKAAKKPTPKKASIHQEDSDDSMRGEVIIDPVHSI